MKIKIEVAPNHLLIGLLLSLKKNYMLIEDNAFIDAIKFKFLLGFPSMQNLQNLNRRGAIPLCVLMFQNVSF